MEDWVYKRTPGAQIVKAMVKRTQFNCATWRDSGQPLHKTAKFSPPTQNHNQKHARPGKESLFFECLDVRSGVAVAESGKVQVSEIPPPIHGYGHMHTPFFVGAMSETLAHTCQPLNLLNASPVFQRCCSGRVAHSFFPTPTINSRTPRARPPITMQIPQEQAESAAVDQNIPSSCGTHGPRQLATRKELGGSM